MAGYKEDKFEYGKYFIGVKKFCFHKVLLDMFSASNNDYSNAQNIDAVIFFGGILNFLPDDEGNASRLFKGRNNAPEFVKSYKQCEENFYLDNYCWVKSFL